MAAGGTARSPTLTPQAPGPARANQFACVAVVGTAGNITLAPTAPPLTKAEQARLERGITAPTIAAEASVLAIEVRSQFEQAGKLLLPVGSQVAINDATFQAVSAQMATVDATEKGPNPGHWQLLGTRKLS
jgi:hypothetical protein